MYARLLAYKIKRPVRVRARATPYPPAAPSPTRHTGNAQCSVQSCTGAGAGAGCAGSEGRELPAAKWGPRHRGHSDTGRVCSRSLSRSKSK